MMGKMATKKSRKTKLQKKLVCIRFVDEQVQDLQDSSSIHSTESFIDISVWQNQADVL